MDKREDHLSANRLFCLQLLGCHVPQATPSAASSHHQQHQEQRLPAGLMVRSTATAGVVCATSPASEAAAESALGGAAADAAEDVDLQEGPARYLGLIGRVGRTLAIVGRSAKAASRYVAYSSDVGEAFRPLVSSTFVKATYGIAYAYVAADVAINSYREHKWTNGDTMATARAGTETLLFQLLASIAVPSLIIHSAVHFTQKMTKTSGGPLQRYAPTVVGLAIIPILPFTIDHPIEHAIDVGFTKVWPRNTLDELGGLTLGQMKGELERIEEKIEEYNIE